MTATLPALLGADAPVTPDADQARRWVVEELADPVYHHRPSLLEQVMEWLGDLFDGIEGLPVSGPGALVVVLAVVAAVTLVAFWIAGPVRRSRTVRGDRSLRALDDARSAAELRAGADRAAGAGDWDTAVAERFRAVVRSLEERAVLDERPGRTAHEAVEAAAPRFAALACRLRSGATVFDDVVYGSVPATAADDDALRVLDTDLTAARPATAADVAAAGGAR